MTEYMLKQPGHVGDSIRIPGEVFEIKKLKHSIQFKDKDEKFKYIVVGKDELLTTKSLKERFTKGTYKSETPKRITKTLLIIFLYELSKYVTTEILIKLETNDVVDTFPTDYEISKWR
ncbi:transcriptional activator RinB [Staphylococcus shinii]|uniref:transcriptional activator RinB n=1 Tax=Staphylococcus shinii TaxID=2912228 RepID=UPI003515491A